MASKHHDKSHAKADPRADTTVKEPEEGDQGYDSESRETGGPTGGTGTASDETNSGWNEPDGGNEDGQKSSGVKPGGKGSGRLMAAVDEIIACKDKLCHAGMEEGRALELVCRVFEMQSGAKK